ncbi:MAG: tetratricopeptide repeat protein [Myxococcales bacterium]|nr:tetratricopeptide repeat protein [Myxococcales bacterium]
MSYGSREVARMIGLSASEVRSYVRAGFLDPARGGRGELRFSFQDIVLLRTAKGLVTGGIPARRVRGALRRLRAQLPPDRPLTGVHIAADGDRIVVTDGDTRWHPESGQALFDFEIAELAHQVAIAPLDRGAPRGPAEPDADRGREDAAAWYQRGCDLEEHFPVEACEAYRRAVSVAPDHADALINLGRLLQEAGDAAAAVAEYLRALAARPGDPTAAFNLGVALEDLHRDEEAVAAYHDALAGDPRCADAHYNLSRIHERTGDRAAALRHLRTYRTITRGR